MGSFSTSVSGLTAAENALSTISNNLANLNTTGYKEMTANFGALFYQFLGDSGSGDPLQIGDGATIDSISTDFNEGTTESTGVNTDMAIQGNGFFVVQNNGVQEYTRAGDFTINALGNLVDANGDNVMGYAATNGVINPSATLAPLQIPNGISSPAQATTQVGFGLNLEASAYNSASPESFSEPIVVYDSLGVSHTLTFSFTQTANNQWAYQITIPAADVGSTGTPVSVGTGTLQFDGNGNLKSPTSNVAVSITTLADGASGLNFTWQLFNSQGTSNITESGAASAASNISQNGFAGGTLTSFNVTSDGVIQGLFSNGQTITLGQVALANFANPQGLNNVGDNNYASTISSGAATIGPAGTGGLGTIQDGALEQSNVDMASEFTKLIMAERDYQANAKAIMTADDVTQTAISLIQS
jgi:flagellar hook protein FlgE